MAGISEIADLEARKRALVAESEACREAFKAELQNLSLLGAGLQKRVDKVFTVGPWLLVALPVVASLIRLLTRKGGGRTDGVSHSRFKGGVAGVLLAWRMFRKYAPLVRGLVTHLRSKNKRGEYRTPAANI